VLPRLHSLLLRGWMENKEDEGRGRTGKRREGEEKGREGKGQRKGREGKGEKDWCPPHMTCVHDALGVSEVRLKTHAVSPGAKQQGD